MSALLYGWKPVASKLISIKVPQDLLNAFRAKSRLAGTPYQTQIKALTKGWLLNQDVPRLK